MDTFLGIALIVSSLSTPLTIFVLFRFGLVGGSPRELLSLQMDTERAKLDVETRRLQIEQEMATLRARQFEVQVSLAEEKAKNPPPPRHAPPQPMMMNPQGGLRTAMPVPPPPTRR